MLNNLDRIISKFNVDENGNPNNIHILRKHQISPIYNGFQLDQIPNDRYGVNIVSPENMYEVYNADEISENTYYVKNDGVVLFDKVMAGKEVLIDYYGRGLELIGASRVYTMLDSKGNVIETLGDVFESGRIVIDAIKTMGDTLVIIEQLNDTVDEAKITKNEIMEAIQTGDINKIKSDISNINEAEIPTMKSDITDLNSQLSDIPKYANMQLVQLHNFLNKIQSTDSIIGVAQGDSLTHGQDLLSSDKRPASDDSTKQEGGSTDVTIGKWTYPEVLQNCLRETYGGNINILKRAFPGDTVKLSLGRWTNNPNADFTICMFGTNDAGYYSDIDKYFSDYYNLIKRILEWGSCVIILTPPKMVGYSKEITTIDRTLKELGRILNIPVIDTTEFFTGYANVNMFGNYTEGVHLNGQGYYNLGVKVASTLIGSRSLINTYKVKTGDSFLTYRQLNHFAFPQNNAPQFFDWGDRVFSGANEEGHGSCVNIPPQGKATYSFETLEDDLILIPVQTTTSTAKCEITLDFNNKQCPPNCSLIQNKLTRTELVIPSTQILFNIGESQKKQLYEFKMSDISNSILIISQKGRHTISIRNNSNDGKVNFEGFYCISLFDFISYKSNYSPLDGVLINKDYSLKGIDANGNERTIARITGTNTQFGDENSDVLDLKAKQNIFAYGMLLPNETDAKDLGASWARWRNIFGNTLVLKSPNNTKYYIRVNDNGELKVTSS